MSHKIYAEKLESDTKALEVNANLGFILHRIVLIAKHYIDIASKIDYFDKEMDDRMHGMDQDMMLFASEIQDNFWEMRVSPEIFEEIMHMMKNVAVLCKKYNYDIDTHDYVVTLQKLQNIMGCRGLL